MRIDSHQHFWKYSEADYPWMTESLKCLRRDFLPEHLAPLLSQTAFDGSILVQVRQSSIETNWMLDLADACPSILGVVGWVDFEANGLQKQLESWTARPKLKGFRELIHDMPDPNYAISDIHIRGISSLLQYGFTYDLLLKPCHLRPAAKLAKQFPDQLFVVDHLGKPDIANGQIASWREDIRSLADCENVFCKLSGMVTEARWHDWRNADFSPFLDVVFESFGAKRLMIGSDWPVCLLSGSYVEVMQIVLSYISALSSDEQEAVLGGTCARFYGVTEGTAYDLLSLSSP